MTTKTKKLLTFLRRLDACKEARDWAKGYAADPEAAWRECDRPDWLFWLVGKLCGGDERESRERKRLVLCACECARLAPPINHEDWEAARLTCLDVTERWARGEGPTLENVREARRASAADAAAAAYDERRREVRAETLRKAADIVRRHYPWDSMKGFLQ